MSISASSWSFKRDAPAAPITSGHKAHGPSEDGPNPKIKGVSSEGVEYTTHRSDPVCSAKLGTLPCHLFANHPGSHMHRGFSKVYVWRRRRPFQGFDRVVFEIDEWFHRRGFGQVSGAGFRTVTPWWGWLGPVQLCDWWDRRLCAEPTSKGE